MAGGNERGGEREKGKTEGILSFFLGCSEEYEFQGLVLCRREEGGWEPLMWAQEAALRTRVVSL